MKVFFESTALRAIKSEHRHDANLEGQMVVIYCTDKEEVVRIDLYKKGQKTYSSCIWINKNTVYVTGSGKANSRFGAIYAALHSAGVSFDLPLPYLGSHVDLQVWDKLEQFAEAIAQAVEVDNYYIHNCLRSN